MGKSLGARMAQARGTFDGRRELVTPDGQPVTRGDGWFNGSTGLGTDADKTTKGYFAPVWRIDDQQLTNLYNGSALAAKVVEKRPREMFRRGYDLQCDDVEESALSDLRDYALEDFKLDEQFLKAMIFGNLYGGYLSILLVDDGGMPDEPLDETRIRSFHGVNGVDRRFAYALGFYNDPTNLQKFGQVSHYLLSNGVAGYTYTPTSSTSPLLANAVGKVDPELLRRRGYGTTVIHESRVIRWEGVGADQVTMQSLAGWSWSSLQRIYDSLRKFEHSFDSANYLLTDASQGVMTIKNLLNSISAGQLPKLRQRLALIEELRSVMHTILLNEGETFERVATPFSGIPDLLDKFMLRFAGDVDMPVTELFGRAPAGLNATGESDVRKWYDTIQSEQPAKLAPPLKRVFRLLSLSKDCPIKLPKPKDSGPLGPRWTIEFRPLATPTDEEDAKTDLAIAQRDVAYIGAEVVTAEEVALSVQKLYPSMDVEAREKSIKGAKSFDPHANDPEPPPPPTPPGLAPPPAQEPPPGQPPAAGKPGLAKPKAPAKKSAA